MTTSVFFMDCSGYTSRRKQRQLHALYNIPPPRLFPASPYPQFTTRQLDMRRKVEILKYSNNQGAGPTKAQKWSNIVRTRTSSEYTVSTASSTFTCPADELIPTSTTQCDVPGPPDILYYDPTVPLYQYATKERAYAVEPAPPYVWRPITQNIVEWITATSEIMAVDDPTSTRFTASCPAGVIVMSNTVMIGSDITFTFGISIAAWLVGVYTGSPYPFDKSPGYDAFATAALPPMLSTPILPDIDAPFALSVTGVTYQILYNDTVVTTGAMSGLPDNTTMSFGAAQVPLPSGQFYGIQYMGTPSATAIRIPNVQPDNIYQVTLQITYTYARGGSVVDKLAAFQTGAFANVDVQHISMTTPNFAFTSAPPPWIPGSFIDYRDTLSHATLTV